MNKKFLGLLLSFCTVYGIAQSNRVSIEKSSDGSILTVDGQPFMINGMNWDYFPVGTNYSYSLWSQSEEVIKGALDYEMSFLKNMGVNTIRVYTGIPSKWIQYIYENYRIYTMLNHAFGRYGVTVDGVWMSNTDYADSRVKTLLVNETKALVEEYRNTPGLLLFLLGNENNYGLFWDGAETEDIPAEDRKSTIRARNMYRLFNEAVVAMKAVDNSHPIAICNGDLLFIELIKEECPDVDIYGTNMYRGVSFGDAFEKVKYELNKPILFTEFGADAYNTVENKEDQESQAYYMLANWREIYENASGLGKSNNSIGGFTFQFSDGWWKFGQTKNLDVHDNNASWANGGYLRDFEVGENNMNEEWFGVCAKGQTDSRGLYQLYPRAAYYTLSEAHKLDPYASEMNLETIHDHFTSVSLMDAVIKARGDKASLLGERGGKIRISEIRAEFTNFVTGGDLITTPNDPDPNTQTFPDRQGFDRLESYFIGIEAKPEASVRANVVFNILGNVPGNPINEIFYENRGREETFVAQSGNTVTTNPNRIQVYQADYNWNNRYFQLDGFYRTGHYHWGYEGDFFGLYPEANYGDNIDIYNGFAPNGFEITGKKSFSGLKFAYGPELWWGANPAFLVKYTKKLALFEVTGIFHEDLEEPGTAVSSIAIPQPKTRRASFYAKTQAGKLDIEVGGIWGGEPLVGREFQVVRGESDSYQVLQDEVKNSDTWGGKVKLTYEGGRFNWYGQASSRGLVASAGEDYTQTFTGWRLKDYGSGNVNNVFTGFTYNVGKIQIAPNFMFQNPMIDPIPENAPDPARLRNIIDDPFVVRSNRETWGYELLLTFDPTPGTWMYEWDNDRSEDAKLAASLGFTYRELNTSQDAAIVFPGTERIPTPADGAAPAKDLWEVYARIVSKINPDLGIIGNLYGGNGQANGSDPRTIERFGGDIRVIYKKIKMSSHVKVDDWGPYDYHQDFNLTFPLQLMADISTSIAKPDWFILPSTQLGLRFTWRSLDQFSPRYNPAQTIDNSGNVVADPTAPGFGNGSEWEFRTYVHINLGK
ncbi:MAG: glycosidase [Bacteroidota bacterium]